MSMGGMQDMQGYGPSGGSTPGMHPSMHQYQPGQQQQQHPGMSPYHQQMPPPQSQMPHHQQYSMQPHYQQQQQQGGMPAPQFPNQNMGMHPQQGRMKKMAGMLL